MQEDWSNGAGQEYFLLKNRIRQSVGWDFRKLYDGGGGPGIALGKRTVAYSSGSLQATSIAKFCDRFQFLNFGSDGTTPALILTGPAAVNDASVYLCAPSSSEDPVIAQIKTNCAAIWFRNGGLGESNPQYSAMLLAVGYSGSADVINVLDPNALATSMSPTTSYTTAITKGCTRVIYGVDNTHLMVFSSSGVGSGGGVGQNLVTQLVIAVDGFTISTGYAASLGSGAPLISNAYAVDSNGYLYLITQNANNPSSAANSGLASQVLIFSPSDMTLTSGPRLTSRALLPPSFYATGIVDCAGSVYILGAFRPNSTEQYAAILKYPNEVIWKSEYNYVGNDNYIKAYYQPNRNEVHFVVQSNLGNYASIMRLRSGDVVEEIGCLPSWTPGTPDVMALGAHGRRHYWYNQGATAISSTNDVPGSLDSSGSYAILELSEFGMNTPLVTKTPYSVTVELSTALPTGESLTVLINDSSLGTMADTDGTSKEITATTDLSARGFKIKVRLPRTTAWTGFIKRITLKYVPTQFKKRAFGIGVRATRALRLADGTFEQTDSESLMAQLWTAWQSNVPVPFVDVDGVSYTVLVTDIDEREPLLSRDGTKLESLVFLELLEV